MSPDKYCQLVEEEGGLALVEEIVNNNRWIDKQPATTTTKAINFVNMEQSSKWQQVELKLSISGEEESEPNQEQVKSLALKVR